MTYKIIGDSCLDLTSEMKRDSRFGTVPLTLQVGDQVMADDEHFDQAKFLSMVEACPQCPQTACPSPELFLEKYRPPERPELPCVLPMPVWSYQNQ